MIPAVSALFVLWAWLAGAALPAEVDAYSERLAAFLGGDPARPGLEELYETGLKASRALLAPDVPGADSPLEALDPAGFDAAQDALQGFILVRVEVVEAGVDPGFFASLALERGDAADAAFFSLLEQTRLVGGWPRYLERRTDFGGCARVAAPDFTSLYAGWRDFTERFPGRYSRAAQSELGALEEGLLHGQVCGRREAVLEGYRRFVAAHPDAPVSVPLRERIAELEAGSSALRFPDSD